MSIDFDRWDFDSSELTAASRPCPWCVDGTARDGNDAPCDCPDCGGSGYLSTRNLSDDEV